MTANDLDASKAEFEAAAKKITDETYGSYSDYDKEKIVHDTLISRVKYDRNAPMNQSAYSALVYGRTVCAGYARAFQYVLHQLDIPCYYVTGFAGENHAWNIVKLSDGYYNVDSTVLPDGVVEGFVVVFVEGFVVVPGFVVFVGGVSEGFTSSPL